MRALVYTRTRQAILGREAQACHPGFIGRDRPDPPDHDLRFRSAHPERPCASSDGRIPDKFIFMPSLSGQV